MTTMSKTNYYQFRFHHHIIIITILPQLLFVLIAQHWKIVTAYNIIHTHSRRIVVVGQRHCGCRMNKNYQRSFTSSLSHVVVSSCSLQHFDFHSSVSQYSTILLPSSSCRTRMSCCRQGVQLAFAAATSFGQHNIMDDDEDGKMNEKQETPINNDNVVAGGGGVWIGDEVHISIEYCSACRWMLRASWIASELLTTFKNEERFKSITLIPTGGGGMEDTEGGIFRVLASTTSTGESLSSSSLSSNEMNSFILWDRKVTGRFPEAKEVKQLVRDMVNPAKDLGHSDVVVAVVGREGREITKTVTTTITDVVTDCMECKAEEGVNEKIKEVQTKTPLQSTTSAAEPSLHVPKNRVTIEYSIGGDERIDSIENGLYRAAYFANELLSMVYERNAWWKRRRQRCLDVDLDGNSNENSESDTYDDDTDEEMPVAVDSVSFVPNRLDRDIFRLKVNDSVLVFEHSSSNNTDKEVVITTIDGGRHLRSLVRDVLSPSCAAIDANLGEDESNNRMESIEMMDEVAAEQARKYFGVL